MHDLRALPLASIGVAVRCPVSASKHRARVRFERFRLCIRLWGGSHRRLCSSLPPPPHMSLQLGLAASIGDESCISQSVSEQVVPGQQLVKSHSIGTNVGMCSPSSWSVAAHVARPSSAADYARYATRVATSLAPPLPPRPSTRRNPERMPAASSSQPAARLRMGLAAARTRRSSGTQSGARQRRPAPLCRPSATGAIVHDVGCVCVCGSAYHYDVRFTC